MIYFGKHLECQNVTCDLEKLVNKHGAIIGSTGAGKTVAIQKLLPQLITNGYTVVVFDVHGVLAPDQIHPALKEDISQFIHDIDVIETGIPYNIFRPIRYPDGSEEPLDICIGSMLEVFSTAFKLQCKQKRMLRTTFENICKNNLFEKYGFSSIDKQLNDLGCESAYSTADKLHYLTSYNVFRDGNELFQEGRINVFRLSKFDLGTQTILEEILLQLFWRLANTGIFKEKPIYLVVDEVQNLPQSNTSGIPVILSEGRRMNLNLLLATQILLKDTASPLFQRIGQVGIKMYFRQPSDRVPLIAKIIDPNQPEEYKRSLKNLKVGEFLLDTDKYLDGKKNDDILTVKIDLEDCEQSFTNE